MRRDVNVLPPITSGSFAIDTVIVLSSLRHRHDFHDIPLAKWRIGNLSRSINVVAMHDHDATLIDGQLVEQPVQRHPRSMLVARSIHRHATPSDAGLAAPLRAERNAAAAAPGSRASRIARTTAM